MRNSVAFAVGVKIRDFRQEKKAAHEATKLAEAKFVTKFENPIVELGE